MLSQNSNSDYLHELLGSKLTWRILRVLVMHPFLSFRLSSLASRLQTSNKSILRIMRKLIEKGLVLGKIGNHEAYKINTDTRMARKIWSIFMSERAQRIPPEIKDEIYPYFNNIKGRIDAFIICEYPSPEGIPMFKDSVSIAVVCQNRSLDNISPIPAHLNVHLFTKDQFTRQDNSVVQTALLGGIVLRGEDFIFSLLSSIKSFPQAYIMNKINTYSSILSQNGSLNEELKDPELELMNKNVHVFEIQFGLRGGKNGYGTLSDRIDNLKVAIAKNNYQQYL